MLDNCLDIDTHWDIEIYILNPFEEPNVNLETTRTLIKFSRTVEEADGYMQEFTGESEPVLNLATLKGMFDFEIIGRNATGTKEESIIADYYAALSAVINRRMV